MEQLRANTRGPRLASKQSWVSACGLKLFGFIVERVLTFIQDCNMWASGSCR
jgi:hypothetical protein